MAEETPTMNGLVANLQPVYSVDYAGNEYIIVAYGGLYRKRIKGIYMRDDWDRNPRQALDLLRLSRGYNRGHGSLMCSHAREIVDQLEYNIIAIGSNLGDMTEAPETTSKLRSLIESVQTQHEETRVEGETCECDICTFSI